MTTTPAQQPHDTPTGEQPLPNAGATPHTPADTSDNPRAIKVMIWTAVICALVLAAIGFTGSYAAVRQLAEDKGFGSFSHAFPIGVDAGIIVFLAIDLILSHKRMPLPPLRWVAWTLTGATVFYNASAGQKPITDDLLAAAMHATIPILFIGAAEAARHYVARLAQITADKHIDGVPLSRWLVAPLSSFHIWRRMRLWNVRSYATVIDMDKEVRVYRARLKEQHGRHWRRKAAADQKLVLELAATGMRIDDAIDLPHREARRLAEAEANRAAEAKLKAEAEAELKHQAELRQTEAEAKRRAEVARAEAAEAEARIEVQAKQKAEAEAARLLVAETEAKLATLTREQELAEAEANLKRQQQAAEAARLQQEQQLLALEARAATARRQREADAQAKAQRITAEAKSRSEATSGSTSGSGRTATSGSGRTSTSGPDATPIGGQRGKRQAEVEAVLARIVEAGDPKAYPLEDVMTDFDLKQTTAYDRLKTAQALYAEAQTKTG